MKCFLLVGFIPACTLAAQSSPGAGSIEGHVLNSLTGAPLRKASVVLTAPTFHLFADTDAEGRFQFFGLPPGTYSLSASRPGFSDRRTPRPILLGPNDPITDAEIRLPPHSMITGRVLYEDGEPVDGARVVVFKRSYHNGSRLWDRVNAGSETNDAGEYRISGLRPGRYLLQAYNYRPQIDNRYGNFPKSFYVPVYYPSVLSQEEASPVAVGVGAEVHGIDIHLLKVTRLPSVRVTGKVTGLQPDSPIIVSVGLRPVGGESFGSNTIANPPDYAFVLSAPPGQYTIFGNVSSGGPEAYGTAGLTVTGDVAGVVLAMTPAPTITGQISLAERGTKVNLQRVRVSLDNLDLHLISGVREGQTDATGKLAFAMPAAPGRYAVNIRSIPDGCFIRELRFGGKEISWDDFEISASSQLEIILSNTAGTIAGSVLDTDSKPVPNSIVTLIPSDGKSRPVKQEANEAGNFRFTGVRPGKFKLFAWVEVDDDLWQDPEFRKDYENWAAEVTVGPGETQNAQLRLIALDAMK